MKHDSTATRFFVVVVLLLLFFFCFFLCVCGFVVVVLLLVCYNRESVVMLQLSPQWPTKPAKKNTIQTFPSPACVQESVLMSSVQSLDELGRRGNMRDDSAEILFQSFLWEATACSSGIGRDAHSLTLSIQHFLCRLWRQPPCKVSWRMALERLSWRVTCPSHASFRL